MEKNHEKSIGEPLTQYEFEQTTGKYATCKYAGEGFSDYIEGESISETVQRVMPDVDWVMIPMNAKPIKKKRRFRVGTFISDLHRSVDGGDSPVKLAQEINEAGYDKVFMRYPVVYMPKYRPDVVYNLIKCDVHWLPWSVDIKRFKPNREKAVDAAFIGSTGPCYPLRNLMWEGLFHVARGFKVIRSCPPLEKTFERKYGEFEQDYLSGKRYSDTLNDTKILLFDSSTYRYPVQKFFEGTAAGCLLISSPPSLAKQIGFIHLDTYVEANVDNWEEVLRFYLENPQEAGEIADHGVKMTRKYHNHDIRSKQFIKVLEE